MEGHLFQKLKGERMSKRYNTPHRTRIIKTRVTEEEHADYGAAEQ